LAHKLQAFSWNFILSPFIRVQAASQQQQQTANNKQQLMMEMECYEIAALRFCLSVLMDILIQLKCLVTQSAGWSES